MRVALYCRVSTDKQDNGNQVEQLREFAARQGWEIVAEHVDTVTGSGKKSRPQFDAMMLHFFGVPALPINDDPTLGAAYLGLGQAYNSLGRFKEAIAPLARLDAILPGAWAADCATGVAHLGIEESEAALQDITRAERVRRVDRQSRSALSYRFQC
jgi:tetratricopeptide (TPR) repeat protein